MEEFVKLFAPEDEQDLRELLKVGPSGAERSKLWGYDMTPGFSAISTKYAYEKWNVRKNDVFIASFPKTGTNFLSEIVRRIIYQDEEMLKTSYYFPEGFFILEKKDPDSEKKFELFDKLPVERRFLVTHLPADLMNIEKIKKAKAKVIVILRNPKDQIVSYLNFTKLTSEGKAEPWRTMLHSDWETYLDHVLAGDFLINSKPGEWYPEYILSWYKHRDNKTVYFVYFEDLKKDPLKEIKLLAEFLEVPLTNEKAAEIAIETSFARMKDANNNLSCLDALKYFRSINMKKGGVGGWKNHFTVSQSERIDAIMEEKLKDTDIKFTYEL